MNLEEQKQVISDIVEQAEYDIKAVKSPKKKRIAKRTKDLFSSILASLNELETLKNNK